MKSRTMVFVALCLCGATAARALQSRAAQSPRPSPDGVLQRFYVNTPRIPLDAAAQLATEIVHGRVEDVRAEFPERGVAKTIYTLRVFRALKGAQDAVIDVAVGGAVGDDTIVDVVGAPKFSLGEELVLFLWTSPVDNETGVLGLSHGVYRVTTEDGTSYVTGDHADHEELDAFFETTAESWLRAEARAEAREGK